MTLRDDFLVPGAPQAPTNRLGPAVTHFWTGLLGALNSPDILVVLYFCAAGLLVSAAFIRMFPDFGALAESLNIFP
jgi:hypothetical protein